MLDKEEMSALMDTIQTSAGKKKLFEKEVTLSNKEAEKLAKELGLEGKDNKVLEFIKSVVAAQKGVKSSSITGDGEDKKVTTAYDDDTEETVSVDGSKTVTSKDANGNTVVKQLSKSGELLKEEIKSPTGEITEKNYENGVLKEEKITNGEKVSTTTYENGNPASTVVKEGLKETVYGADGEAGGKPLSIKDGDKTTTFVYGEDGKITSTSVENGKKTVEVKNGKIVESSITEENGVKSTKVKNDDGNLTETIEKDGTTIVNEYNLEGKKLSQTKSTADGNTFSIDYNGEGNTNVIVQNGESIVVLAKKFGCSTQEIIKANSQAVKGTAPNQYFLVGSEVKIPKELEADNKTLQGRKTVDEVKGAYADFAQKQKAEQEAIASRKKISFTEKKYNTFNELAIGLFKKEGIANPTKKQIEQRVAELKTDNKNLVDGQLVGKRVIAGVAPDIHSKIANKEQEVNEYRKNINTAKDSKSIANELYNACDDESAAVGDNRFNAALSRINKDNVDLVLVNYRELPQAKGETLLDTICSEVGSSEESRKKALNHIMNAMMAKAKAVGVSANDLFKAQNDFKTAMNIQFRSIGTIDTKNMDTALDFLHGAMLAKTTAGVEDIDATTARTSFLGEASVEFEGADKTYQDARKEEGWAAKTGDTVLGWFGCVTKEDMDEKLGAHKAGIQKMQNAKTEAEFNNAYYEVFGIDFDKNKVAAYEAAQGNYQKASMLLEVSKSVNGLLNETESKSYSSLAAEIKQKMKLNDATLDDVVKSYLENPENPTDEDKKQALIKFLEQTKSSTSSEYASLTKGKSVKQLGEDLDLIRKSAFGTKDIVKDVIKYNENQVITEMATTATAEILGTIALQFVPGLGQVALARLAVSATKWGATGVKIVKMANTAQKGFQAVNKLQQLNKVTRTVTASVNAGVATAGVGLSDGKDAKSIAERAAMNMAFAGVGSGANAIAPQLMKTLGVTRQVAIDVAEELLSAAGSAGVVSMTGGEYTTKDGFTDFVSGFIMSRVAGRYVGKHNDLPHQDITPEIKPKQRVTGDKFKSIIPESEGFLDKVIRDGNNSAEIAKPRSVGKLSSENFAKIQIEIDAQLAKTTSAGDLAKLEKQIDALQDRGQRRILEAKLKNKKVQLEQPAIKKEEQPIAKEEPVLKPDSAPVGEKLAKNKQYEFDALNDQVQLNLAEHPVDMKKFKNIVGKLDDGQSIIIGRKTEGLDVGFSNVSREHLKVTRQGDKFIIEDLSLNGTKIESKGHSADVEIPPVSVSVSPVAKSLPEIDSNELVRVAGNNGKPINPKYISTSREVRSHLNDAIESRKYTDSPENYIAVMNQAHVISYQGKSGHDIWYTEVGEGGLEINPGHIRRAGGLSNSRINSAIDVEELAKKYGDPYRVKSPLSKVKLEGIPDAYLPKDIYNSEEGYKHFYPEGSSLEKYYYKEMHRTSKETLSLIAKGAPKDQILRKIAEHYQYAANARPYGQINNSLFMNEVNTLLSKAGLSAMPHGNLDHAAMRLQPEGFKKYFIDEYTKTALPK